MKKIFYVLTMALFVLSFVCCEKNESQEDLLVGDWSLTSIAHYEMEGGAEVLVQTTNITDKSLFFLSLAKDGTGFEKVEGDLISFKWKIVGNQLMLYVENELLTTYEIKSLTKKQMILTTYIDKAHTARVEQTFVKQ